MTKLTILHLSDLHHLGRKAVDQTIVLQSLKDDLSEIKNESKIDFVIFSGDLVQAGGSVESFNDAKRDFIDAISSEIGLDESSFIICPGNHDVDRECVRKQGFIETGLLNTLKTRDEINSFIDQYIDTEISSDIIPEAFARMQHFYKAIWVPKIAEGAIVTPFSSIQKIKVDGVDVAVCAFNSAWRCTGEGGNAERGNLIIGERVIDRAVKDTGDVAVRIAVFHHPFDWLTEADRTAVEARLHSEFHAFFFGHVHNAQPTYTKSAMGGAVYSQAGCLYENRNYFNGYSIVELDLQTSIASIVVREYSDRIRKFVPALGAVPGGKVSFDFPFLKGANGSNLMALLATVRPEIKRLGDEHVRLASDETAGLDLEKHFICPPLSRPKRVVDEESDKPGEETERLTLGEVLDADENIVLLGPPESGKTSIIHFAALKVVSGQVRIPRLPLRAKFYDFKRGRSPIWRAVRAYANEVSDGKITASMIENTPILLFVDEVVPSDDQQLAFVLSIMKDAPNIRWVLVSDGSTKFTNVSAENDSIISNFTTISIGELSRTSIRRLSAQWLEEDIEAEATNKIFNKVMEHITRSGLPRNGYIVSLILWTLREGLAGELINEAILLENIIDYMLGKMDYRDSLRSNFDYTSKVAVLQELSIYFRTATSSITKNEVVAKVIEYLDRKGLKFDGAKIVSGFVECGIFSEVDDVVEFKYSRFKEYFAAGYLRDNKDAFEEVISSPDWKNYFREMDIYTSRFRNETSLLAEGRKKVDQIDLPVPKLDGKELEEYLADAGNYTLAAKRLKKMKKEPMSARKIDELRDRADASVNRKRSELSKRKQDGEKKFSTIVSFINALHVYSQFIRNLEFADNVDKKVHLNHCFELWEKHAKLLLSGLHESFEEIKEDIRTDPEVPDEIREDIVQIARDFEDQVKLLIPSIVASLSFHNIGTEKLVYLVEEIAENENNSKLKRILASFVLMDLDPVKCMDMMSSTSWHENMNDGWISSVVENKLHQYYLEQHLAGNVRTRFERFVATLEARLNGTKFETDRMKGIVIQRLEKSTLLADLREKGE